MNAPVEDSTTSSTQIKVTWTPLTANADTGADTIIYYSLEWNQGSVVNTWVELTTPNNLVTSFTQTSGFTPGTTYSYRLRAKNSYGYGPYSSTVSITPASAPSQIATATTTVDTVYAKIAWAEPASNGASITGYRVYIQQKSGSYRLESTYCSESDATVTANKYCLVPMSELTGSNYLLVRGDLVVAKVQATNSKG